MGFFSFADQNSHYFFWKHRYQVKRRFFIWLSSFNLKFKEHAALKHLILVNVRKKGKPKDNEQQQQQLQQKDE